MRTYFLLLPLLFSACFSMSKKPNQNLTPTRTVELEPIRITASANDGEIRSEAYDATSLFEEASNLFEQGDFSLAVRIFTKVFEEFPESSYALPARYNAALSLESLEKWQEALEGYQELLLLNENSLSTRFRMAHCLANLDRYSEVLEILSPVESRADMGGQQLIELHARKSQALFHLDDLAQSKDESKKAIDIYRKIRQDEELATDYYISMAQYYDAKVLAKQGKELPIRVNSGKKILQQDLDSKAELLLLAQSSYIKVLKLANRQFATMAGFEIGLLYEDFYHQILNAPLPDELTSTEEQVVYLEVLAQETRILLEKSLRIYEKNVLLGERVGLKNEFIKQSESHIQAIKAILDKQNPKPSTPLNQEKPKNNKGKTGDFPTTNG